jgi:hypothetical protein
MRGQPLAGPKKTAKIWFAPSAGLVEIMGFGIAIGINECKHFTT